MTTSYSSSEATVIGNAYSVQYGWLGGAQLIETTRAGTNQFHGNMAFWWNAQNLNANDYFNAQQNIYPDSSRRRSSAPARNFCLRRRTVSTLIPSLCLTIHKVGWLERPLVR